MPGFERSHGSGAINQRGFPGGALSGYGRDRWNAEDGGCNVSVASGRFSLTGSISQTIEQAGLAGKLVTVSAMPASNALDISLGSQSGTIPAGAMATPCHIRARRVGTRRPEAHHFRVSETTFGDVQVELGQWPTPFERRPAALEDMICKRYFEVAHPVSSGATISGGTFRVVAPYTVAKPDCRGSGGRIRLECSPDRRGIHRQWLEPRHWGASIFFVANATSSSASVQLKVFASAEF